MHWQPFTLGGEIISPYVAAEVARLERMTTGQVAARFREIFGEDCRSHNKRYLLRRIAWRLQSKAEGGLSERALKRAEELAKDADVRVTPPRSIKVPTSAKPARFVPKKDNRLPPAGCWIEREYRGIEIRVRVAVDGFEYEGQRYRTLSAVAKAITGSHVNGFRFFQLEK
jgi:hypothetical protein